MNESEKKLMRSTDAKVWAEEFVRLVKANPSIATDESTMIGWFANAIMVGYDKGKAIWAKCHEIDQEMMDEITRLDAEIEDIKSKLNKKTALQRNIHAGIPLRIENAPSPEPTNILEERRK